MTDAAETEAESSLPASRRRLEAQRVATSRLGSLRSRRRKRRFYYGRVSVLMAVFLGVAAWAALDIRNRRARTEWTRPLSVGLVLVRLGPVAPSATSHLRDRISALGDVLQREYARYRHDPLVPFRFKAYGPIDVASKPPELADETVFSLARYAFDRWRYLRDVNSELGLGSGTHDSLIYLVIRPPASREYVFVEGASEVGGRIGMVQVELDDGSVDTSLFVVAHELFHTLGARDKYDALGRTLIPQGLAEPDLVPRFPQRYAELMARNIVNGPNDEHPPERIDELRVGPATADEVDWK